MQHSQAHLELSLAKERQASAVAGVGEASHCFSASVGASCELGSNTPVDVADAVSHRRMIVAF
jgi:hypothetical protein